MARMNQIEDQLRDCYREYQMGAGEEALSFVGWLMRTVVDQASTIDCMGRKVRDLKQTHERMKLRLIMKFRQEEGERLENE